MPCVLIAAPLREGAGKVKLAGREMSLDTTAVGPGGIEPAQPAGRAGARRQDSRQE